MDDLDHHHDPPADMDHDDPRDAVLIETETGVLLYEPGEPDAWIHTSAPADLE